MKNEKELKFLRGSLKIPKEKIDLN